MPPAISTSLPLPSPSPTSSALRKRPKSIAYDTTSRSRLFPASPTPRFVFLLAPDHDTVMAYCWSAITQMNSSSAAALRAAVEPGGFKKLAVARGDLIWLSRHLDVWRRLCVRAPELEVIVIVWQNNHRFAERIGVAVDEEGGESVGWRTILE
ncbi:hypothetical protein ONS95_011366 [Cadophora gregata]|uniref:uncharacterized protein n=1 Tax=Cadophora gregata TaxID=51156 RepID=UPI0026DB5ED9|nr:uncharacterized protein ONS95_011366 [Cadophora gregata]KAK0119942.1 hypothetical protein ONS95_011366 [Cadophora gregata]KAK0120976.1 hypothetical protein ONS96_011169 [Cadophora gregata f. sp. sojae]